jgi:DNA-binding transcriptional regulator GbsR (MarR family)
MTIREIEQATGRSHSHVDSVVRYLKRHELIRLYGNRGSAALYTSMPNTGLKETDDALAAA